MPKVWQVRLFGVPLQRMIKQNRYCKVNNLRDCLCHGCYPLGFFEGRMSVEELLFYIYF